MNFKTVQSFGYDDLIVNKYKELLRLAWKISRCANIKKGVAFGVA